MPGRIGFGRRLRRCGAIIGPKWFTQRRTGSYETAMPPSASKSSMSPKLSVNSRLMYDLWREPISGVAQFPPTLGYSAYVHPTSYRRRDEALAADPHVGSAAAADVGVELCSLEELVKRSDFVVVACLLNKETRHLLNPARLALMKPTAYLINVARGPIVDEEALIAALRDERIAGAGLDVFEQEPPDPANALFVWPLITVEPGSGLLNPELSEAPAPRQVVQRD